MCLVDDQGASAGLVALVLVLLEVGAALVFLGLPGLVEVVHGRVLVVAQVDAVCLEESAGVLVGALDEEGLREDLDVFPDAEFEGVEQAVVVRVGVDGVGDAGVVFVELHRFELLALDDSGVFLLLLDDLHFVRGQRLDDALAALSKFFLIGLENLFTGLAVEHDGIVFHSARHHELGHDHPFLI